jgi:DNA-binding MarR family transcriptional regulator
VRRDLFDEPGRQSPKQAVLDALGRTHLQPIALVALYEQDDQTVSGLGDKLFFDSSMLTPLWKRREPMGHLTRQRNPWE